MKGRCLPHSGAIQSYQHKQIFQKHVLHFHIQFWRRTEHRTMEHSIRLSIGRQVICGAAAVRAAASENRSYYFTPAAWYYFGAMITQQQKEFTARMYYSNTCCQNVNNRWQLPGRVGYESFLKSVAKLSCRGVRIRTITSKIQPFSNCSIY